MTIHNGSWRGKVTVGYDADGKEKFRWVSGKTQGEALTKVSELKARLASGTYSDTKLRIGEYLELWLEHKKLEVKPRTVEFYAKHGENYICPHIGSKRLDKLTTADVRRLLLELKGKVSAYCANKTAQYFSEP